MTKRYHIGPHWFIHHGILLEWNYEPIPERIAYIKNDKPHGERVHRLLCLRKVKHPNLLPEPVLKLGLRYARAVRALDRNWTVENHHMANKLRHELRNMIRRHHKAIARRHWAEYPHHPVTRRRNSIMFSTFLSPPQRKWVKDKYGIVLQ